MGQKAKVLRDPVNHDVQSLFSIFFQKKIMDPSEKSSREVKVVRNSNTPCYSWRSDRFCLSQRVFEAIIRSRSDRKAGCSQEQHSHVRGKPQDGSGAAPRQQKRGGELPAQSLQFRYIRAPFYVAKLLQLLALLCRIHYIHPLFAVLCCLSLAVASSFV